VKNESLLIIDKMLQALSRRIWKLTDKTEVRSLLDLGCGYGFHIPFPSAKYKIGLDIHRPSLKYAKGKFDDVILADVRILPIRLESIDQVSMMETTEYST
jgi:SAM-dependent methyltransferase